MVTLGLWSLSLGPAGSKHGGTVSRNDNGGSGDKVHPERHGKATVKRQGKESSRRYRDNTLEAFLRPFESSWAEWRPQEATSGQ